jgi:hypothetical protein
MNPIIIILPLVIVLGGLLTFFLVPLELGLRAALLASDVVAAGIVGIVLWRRYRS